MYARFTTPLYTQAFELTRLQARIRTTSAAAPYAAAGSATATAAAAAGSAALAGHACSQPPHAGVADPILLRLEPRSPGVGDAVALIREVQLQLLLHHRWKQEVSSTAAASGSSGGAASGDPWERQRCRRASRQLRRIMAELSRQMLRRLLQSARAGNRAFPSAAADDDDDDAAFDATGGHSPDEAAKLVRELAGCRSGDLRATADAYGAEHTIHLLLAGRREAKLRADDPPAAHPHPARLMAIPPDPAHDLLLRHVLRGPNRYKPLSQSLPTPAQVEPHLKAERLEKVRAAVADTHRQARKGAAGGGVGPADDDVDRFVVVGCAPGCPWCAQEAQQEPPSSLRLALISQCPATRPSCGGGCGGGCWSACRLAHGSCWRSRRACVRTAAMQTCGRWCTALCATPSPGATTARPLWLGWTSTAAAALRASWQWWRDTPRRSTACMQ